MGPTDHKELGLDCVYSRLGAMVRSTMGFLVTPLKLQVTMSCPTAGDIETYREGDSK